MDDEIRVEELDGENDETHEEVFSNYEPPEDVEEEKQFEDDFEEDDAFDMEEFDAWERMAVEKEVNPVVEMVRKVRGFFAARKQAQEDLLTQLDDGDIELPYFQRNYLLLKRSMKTGFSKILFKYLGISIKKMSREEFLIQKYSDISGRVEKLFSVLQMKKAARLEWLELWCEMDDDDNNCMDYGEYCSFFGFDEEDELADKSFSLMNQNLNGCISFGDFLAFAWRYCPIDDRALSEFAFRFLFLIFFGIFCCFVLLDSSLKEEL